MIESKERPLCGNCRERPARTTSQGWKKHCIECSRDKKRSWRLKNRDRENERFRGWRTLNVDRERERSRKWRAANLEGVKARMKRWRAANCERIKEHDLKRTPESRRCKPETRKKIKRRYRMRRVFRTASSRLMRQTTVRVPPIALWGLWKSQHGRCALTGRTLDARKPYGASLDHIVPKSKGGKTERENLQWVCHSVNIAKSALTETEFKQLCSDVVTHNLDCSQDSKNEGYLDEWLASLLHGIGA